MLSYTEKPQNSLHGQLSQQQQRRGLIAQYARMHTHTKKLEVVQEAEFGSGWIDTMLHFNDVFYHIVTVLLLPCLVCCRVVFAS